MRLRLRNTIIQGRNETGKDLDAILVLSGGVTPEGDLPQWVRARFDKAIEMEHHSRFLVPLSRNTPHKPPVVIGSREIYECDIGADYLIEHNVDKKKIIAEPYSRETIASAFYARKIVTDANGLRNILAVTSEFHYERTLMAFKWVFEDIAPHNGYSVRVISVPNQGLSPEEIAARKEWEQTGIERLQKLKSEMFTMRQLEAYFSSEAYKSDIMIVPPPDEAKGTY
jgi:uncharacterized SAM-binding protein YcdF (DUF218 family)